VDLSIPANVHVSLDSSAFIFSEDDPSFVDPRDHLSDADLTGDNLFDSDDDTEVVEPERKKMKDLARKSHVVEEPLKVGSRKWKNKYDLIRKYQLKWVARLPWSKGLLKEDGLIHQVRCKICSCIKKKEFVMAPKWDTIWKHGQRECHKTKALLYAARKPISILD
jgi:hypothetical protein